jgi:hypothetical protein
MVRLDSLCLGSSSWGIPVIGFGRKMYTDYEIVTKVRVGAFLSS